MEKKIYSDYAFDKDHKEKYKINYEIYQELINKYKVYRDDNFYKVNDEILNDESFDIIIGRDAGYNHADYIIHRNRPDLNNDELALLCDCGNLCFEYTVEENKKKFYVFED